MIRTGLNIAALFSVLFLPWWAMLCALVILVVVVSAPEALLYGLLADVLYGTPLPAFLSIPLIFTACALMLYILSILIRQHLAWYH